MKNADTAACEPCRQSRTLFSVLPDAAFLKVQTNRSVAIGKPLEIGGIFTNSEIHAACRIFGCNVAAQHDFVAAGIGIRYVDFDVPVTLRKERRSIRGCIVRLCAETFERHLAARRLYGLALLRTADVDFRHTGNRHRTASVTDAPSMIQRCCRSRIVHHELQCLRLDVDCLAVVIGDAGGFLDARCPAAALDRQHIAFGINMDICAQFDCPRGLRQAVLIRDARILGEKICAVRQADVRVDVLLIRCRAEDARREVRLRLLRIDCGRIAIAALTR